MTTHQETMSDFESHVESIALADLSEKLSELGVIFTDAGQKFSKDIDADVMRDNPKAHAALCLHAEVESLLWKVTHTTREFLESVDELRSSNVG